jgi:6-pyruvoyltetrahydropterin/6-carboxytetrahydropterin synthase
MRSTVAKRIEFPAGHRLMNYEGKCYNIHGHSFIVEALFSADTLDEMGFVIDFTEIGHFLKDWIDVNWDHAFIANSADIALIEFLKEHKMKYYTLDANPTTEQMAIHLFTVVQDWVYDNAGGNGLQTERIRVWESSNAYSQYEL